MFAQGVDDGLQHLVGCRDELSVIS